MKVVLAGATGFIGRPLAAALRERGCQVTALLRRPGAAPPSWRGGVEALTWDGRTAGGWVGSLEGAGAVVNLAGESLAAGRWTRKRKLAIRSSRVKSTKALVRAMELCKSRPAVLVNASAVGFYGDGDEPVDESSPAGRGFLADVCQEWEEEALAARKLGVRVVLARFGVVLGPGGGALPRMALPFRLFAGGPLGSGRQWLSWVHRDDAVAALLFALRKESLSGPVNVVAPAPATNRDFSAALGAALGRPSWLPAPAFALKLALGEMSTLLLGGQRALPRRLEDEGFKFLHPTLESALLKI